jgi:hypothetical protein
MKSFIAFLAEEIYYFNDFEYMKPVSVTKEKHRSNYQYIVDYGTDETFKFTPYKTTTYKKTGPGNRLRDPGGTRREVWVDVSIIKDGKYISSIRKTFGKGTGEISKTEEKIKIGTEKAQKWFKKHLGVDLGQYDFFH